MMQGSSARAREVHPVNGVTQPHSVAQPHRSVWKLEIIMANDGDVEMVDATAKEQDPNTHDNLLQTNHSDAFAFSEAEQLALSLYDQLRELELQQSLLQAQESGTETDFYAHMEVLNCV
jgi:hypothetical protein